MNFSILPWEHPGSDFDAAPHALSSLEVNGAARAFGIKMRDGVIYFKEDGREAMWAIPRLFAQELAGDESALCETWREYVERQQFGRFVARHFTFPDTEAHGLATMIHGSDGSGWIKEWFDSNWLDVPPFSKSKQFDVWGQKYESASKRAIASALPALLDRALPPLDLVSTPARWVKGTQLELERAFALGVRAFVGPREPRRRVEARFNAHGVAGKGGVVHGFNSPPFKNAFRVTPAFLPWIRALDEAFLWVGCSWFEGRQSGYRSPDWLARSESLKSEQVQKWGEKWRGLWDFWAPQLRLSAPVGELSAHERLESRFQLFEWIEEHAPEKRAYFEKHALL